MRRPRVAVLVTTYFPDSHADVLVTPLLTGYRFGGSQVEPRVEVASMYLEQLGTHDQPDIGVEIADRYGVPRYETVAEAIGLGRGGVNVDGVAIIAEHGDYELNEFGQKLYPRRRLFDAAVATMVGAGRRAPIFNDKHLAWSFADARAMTAAANRLGIPLLAGGTIPLSWRIPTGAEWPWGAPMADAVVVGFGPTEIYGFHNLEALQVHAERRAGGETGVAAVQALTGSAATAAVVDGTVDRALLDRALGTFDLDERRRRQAVRSVKDVFLLDYDDGLRAAVVNCDEEIRNFGVACRGPADEMACQIWLQPAPYGHAVFQIRQIEALVLNGAAPYPAERTLLTTGVLDAAMRSRHDGGARHETPELTVAYRTVEHIGDTGIALPLPDDSLPR